jgi:hypothetical protein
MWARRAPCLPSKLKIPGFLERFGSEPKAKLLCHAAKKKPIHSGSSLTREIDYPCRVQVALVSVDTSM